MPTTFTMEVYLLTISEFRVRREIVAIRASDASPVAKARKILRIGKHVRAAAMRLGQLSFWSFQQGDGRKGTQFRNAMHRLTNLYQEMRQSAGEVLDGKPKLTYGYGPVGEASPKWSTPTMPEEARS